MKIEIPKDGKVIILAFDNSSNSGEYLLYINGLKYHCQLLEIQQKIRYYLKYTDQKKETIMILEEIRGMIDLQDS